MRVSVVVVFVSVAARTATVWDMVRAFFVATARDDTDAVFVRLALLLAVARVVMARDDDVSAVALTRGDNAVDVRAVRDRTVVEIRDWDAVSDLLRETAVPSRTAAPATPAHNSRFAAKIRIFFKA